MIRLGRAHCAAIVLVLPFAALACNRQPDTKNAPPFAFTDHGAAAQKRISRMLQESVITPKLRECWGQLQGKGGVAIDLIYSKSGDKWTFDKANPTSSSLEKGQDAAAARCLDDAAKGSSLALDSNEPVEKASAQFYVRLGVSVPLPAEGAALGDDAIAMMRNNGGGNGVNIPGCSECVSNPNYPYGLKCESRASGGHLDCQQGSDPNVCSTASTTCLMGIWGGSRGVIMF